MAGVGVRVVLKVSVLGDFKTGKSSVIRRYVDGSFSRLEPTSGIDFRLKDVTVSGLSYSYEIWDIYKWTLLEDLGWDFWKDISGCVLVFDVTRASSFCVLDKMCSSVQSVTKRADVPLMVLGNMADCKHSSREVSTEVVEEWCKKIGALFFEVSAKSGSGVNESFQALAEKAAKFYNQQDNQISIKKPSRFSVPFLKKVTTNLKFRRTSSVSVMTDKNETEGHDDTSEKNDTEADGDTSNPSPMASILSLPARLWVPRYSRKKAKQDEKDGDDHPVLQKQVEELQKQLEIEKATSQMLREKINDCEKQVMERTLSIQTLQNQLSELQRNLQEKVAECRRIEDINQSLCQQIVELQSVKNSHQPSSCWEVSVQEVELDRTKILGTGAWGYVVEGRFRGQKVAVKCLHSLIQQPQFLQTIRREIDIMARLRHPHLLLFIAVAVQTATGPMIITELLDTSLRRAYEQNQLLPPTTVIIFREVASALNYLHLQDSGIIHRDVSSANVLLEQKSDRHWKAKLSDFGSANLIRQSATVGPGAMVYAAPEVRTANGELQTPKVDVYSFGVLMTEVLLCKFPSTEEFQVMLEGLKVKWPTAYPVAYSCTRERPMERPTMALLLEQLNELVLVQTNV